jgi:uncharacterized protein YaaR (DUF327 family)
MSEEKNNEELTSKQIVGIVKKLVGQTDWWGETNKDNQSLENLKVLDEVIYELVNNICDKFVDTINAHESSVKSLNQKYFKILSTITDTITEAISVANCIKQ